MAATNSIANPASLDKYLYIRETPAWKVRSLYLFGIVSWLLVVFGFWGLITIDPFFTWFVTPIVALLTMYHLASFGLNLFYRQFDLKKHWARVMSFWIDRREPTVDIFLPVCGEDITVLRNTWEHVRNIPYRNKRVYVLDDSKENCDEHWELAQQFSFTYLERPNKGEMKKAGNLKHAYEKTDGEFIVIFDADFAPHPDFLRETLPYMIDENVGIVQTPQYFEASDTVHKQSPLAYNAAFAEEPFYRFIQVTRSRFGGTICCGSNAVYRRSALQKIGGPVQMDYSEDAHTGFALTSAGYRVLFVPVLLAIGLCPDNAYSFFHQQHRWCMGSMRLMMSKKFWLAPISWRIKFCYITGFMFYLHHPLTLVFSFHLFWTLFLYNEFIPLGNTFVFYPHIVFAVTYLWLFPIAKMRLGYFNILIARTYAYAHAVKTALLGKSVGWISTNAKHTSISPAFRQVSRTVSVYVALYFLLTILALRTGDLHLFDHRYLSIQFWIFWNLVLSFLLLWQLRKTIFQMRRQERVARK